MRNNNQDKPKFAFALGTRTREVPWWAWIAATTYMILAYVLIPSRLQGDLALAGGFFALSGMCFFNYNSCGRYHCKITSWGFMGLGILDVLYAFGIGNIIPSWVFYGSLVAIVVAGLGLERRYHSETGSCYVDVKK